MQQEFKDGRVFSDALLIEVARLDREYLADVDAKVLVTASAVSFWRASTGPRPTFPSA